MKKLLLILAILTISGCIPGLDNTIEASGKAVKDGGIGVGAANFGIGANKLAESQIEKQKTAQLKIKENATALEIGVAVVNSIVDEYSRLEAAKALLQERQKRLADEQDTKRTELRTNAIFWFLIGIVVGITLFILGRIGLSFANRIEGNLKLKSPK